VLTLVLALGIGVTLGLLGGGGSILTVPVFTYVAGLDPKVAIAASLPVIAVTSAVGTVGHWRGGRVQLRVALLFGAFAMVGGFAGARLAGLVSGQTQLLLFAAIMLAASVAMLRAQPETAAPNAAAVSLGTLAPLGIGVGVLTGLVGVGGGFLIVPALTQLGGLPMHRAVGTSLAVIALNSLAGTLGYLGQVPLPLGLLAPFTALAVLGILGGSALASRVPHRALRRAFGVLLLVVGSFVLYQNRTAFAASAVASAVSDSEG
jgi:uncharacterized membrane protein YfcA